MLKTRIFTVTILLLSSIALAKEVVITSPTTQVLSSQSSQQAWQSLPNKIDPQWLDHFIATYPRAAETPVAFTLRYQVLQGIREAQGIKAVPIYHAFIGKYRHTLAAHQAQLELLQLYHEQHKKVDKNASKLAPVLARYLEFMYRYPDTALALVAKAFAEQVAFEQTVATNEVDEYEAFMQLFPTAPQVPAAEKLAMEKAIATERTKKEKLGSDKDIEHRVNTLCRQFEIQVKKAVSLSEQEKSLISQYSRQFQRQAQVILDIYSEVAVASCVRREERHQELIDKLDEIKKTIQSENSRLIGAIQEEFAKTRQVLTKGFAQLHHDNQKAQASLNKLLDGVNQLHQDLQEVNKNLRGIKFEVKQVGEYVKEGNRKLDLLHKDLTTIQGQIGKLNHDMNHGMKAQQVMLAEVKREIANGTQAIVGSQKAIVNVLNQQTQVIYRSTDLLLTENRRTRQEITRLGRNMSRYVTKHKKKSCNWLCRTIKVVKGGVRIYAGDYVGGTMEIFDGITD